MAPITQPNQVVPPPAQPNKAFTNKTVPAPPLPERELTDSEIIAKPLRTPDFINLKHKNPNMVIFWGNRAVGEKESKMRFSQLIAMGFKCAEPKNVYLPGPNGEKEECPEALAVDGRILWGDLIAMEVPKKDYVGQLKWNAETASKRVQRPGIIVRKDDKGQTGSAPALNHPKLHVFSPAATEAAALTGATNDKTPDI